ncbi:leucine-rich repeat-containing protein 57-like [Lineus longissimus]|uniref:leucine-rich repeat-containing protein 57-like n=1 Tax=Lineus longissimus TaxID=88925 RepID=UPI002B4DDA39
MKIFSFCCFFPRFLLHFLSCSSRKYIKAIMGNTIKPHIERAEKSGACQLCGMGITEFPMELKRLTKNLRTLDLSDNKLPLLPPDIGQFTMLKSLTLTSNRLTALPEDIGKLKKLETLLLATNRIPRLPATICNLSSLRTVNLSKNGIREFPAELCGLKNLDSIDLSHNNIVVIPDGVRGLQAVELNVNQNQINTISEAISECPRLKVLRLEENCVEIGAFTPKIMKQSTISLLAIEGNLFDTKAFHQLEGYDEYMERYTATKKKWG